MTQRNLWRSYQRHMTESQRHERTMCMSGNAQIGSERWKSKQDCQVMGCVSGGLSVFRYAYWIEFPRDQSWPILDILMIGLGGGPAFL